MNTTKKDFSNTIFKNGLPIETSVNDSEEKEFTHETKFIYPEDFESKNDGIKFSEDEINERVEKFKQAIKDINDCKFEPNQCENSCKYCPYKDFCNMNII